MNDFGKLWDEGDNAKDIDNLQDNLNDDNASKNANELDAQNQAPEPRKPKSPQELARHLFKIVETMEAPFKTSKEGKAWAKANGIVGMMTNAETNGKGEINISASSISEMLNLTQLGKSVSHAAHYAALIKLRDIIRESELVDEHPHYKKDINGTRKPNEIHQGTSIHVLYGAIRYNGETYRVKTTLRKFTDINKTTKAYSYEVNTIEVLSKSSEGTQTFSLESTSITGENLLRGVKNANGDFIIGEDTTISTQCLTD